ncbi:glycosyltransferase family 4 protein [Candidatus Woesebacteria bacterium]|nr:glycosyltransferase family 4 protein [Candidatus Woesebacteria bacterium]
MNILFVYDNLSATGGGSQIATLTLFKSYKKLGINVKLLTTKKIFSVDKTISNRDVLLCPEINLEFLYPFSLAFPILSSKMKAKILDFAPDVIHLNEPSFISWHTCVFANHHTIPIIDHYHTNHDQIRISSFPLSLLFNKYGIGNYLESSIKLQILRKATLILAPTNSVKKLIERKVDTTVVVVPYSILDTFFRKPKLKQKKPLKLILVSRIENQKKISNLITTMSLLKHTYTLDIYGDGPDKEIIQKLIHTQGLENRVQLKGWVHHNDLPAILRQYDLFVSLSDFETFGLTYIEALACGVPCVVYDYAITREIIPHSMAIFIPDFNPKSWARTLVELKNNPPQYARLLTSIRRDYNKLEKYREDIISKKMLYLDQKITESAHVRLANKNPV